MKALDDRVRVKRRNEARIAHLRRRLTVLSVSGFAVFFVLAGQHVVGSSKRRIGVARQPGLAGTRQPASYFDERDDGYAFGDEGSGASNTGDNGSAPQASAPPPVAQTSVS